MNTANDRRTERRTAWVGGGIGALAILVLVSFLVLSGRGAPADTPAGQTPAPTRSGVTVEPGGERPQQGATPPPTSPQAPPSAPDPGRPYTPPELPPVTLDTPSERESGVVVLIDSVERVQGEARLPGEVAAPTLRYTIVIRNGSAAQIDLGTVVVNGYAGEDLAPLETLAFPGGDPFAGTLAPGQQAKGVYLFSVPTTDLADVTVTVDPKAGEPASVFRGDAVR